MKKASLIFLTIIAGLALIGASNAFAVGAENGGSTNGGGWGGPIVKVNGVELNGGKGNGGATNGGRGNGGATNGGRGNGGATNGGQENGGQENGGQENGAGSVKAGNFIKSDNINTSGLQLNGIILPGK